MSSVLDAGVTRTPGSAFVGTDWDKICIARIIE